MMVGDSINIQKEVSATKMVDYFNVEGFDEFGGYYDERWLLSSQERANKHEFKDIELDDDYYENDDLIAQFENDEDDDNALDEL